MAVVDVIKCCLDSIRQISEHVEGTIVYLDAGCSESFQFIGAFPVLLELGARAICSLENLSSHDAVVDWNSKFDPPRNIVVITSRFLSDAHRYILRCLSTHQTVRYCTVFTSISEAAHSAYSDSPLGPDAFREYESLLVQDYEELVKRRRETKSVQSGDSNLREKLTLEDEKDEGWSQLTSSEEDISHYEAISSARASYEDSPVIPAEDVGQKLVVSVHHFPLILCPFSPRVFVLPSEGSIAEAYLSAQHEDSLSPGLPPLSIGMPSDGDDVAPGATLTAQFLYHLAAKMDLKMEIFSLGDLSKTVGKLMTDMSSLYDVGRRKRSAGLLLVDRTLDLLTPCCHGDSLVDRIFGSLPRRERTSSINMRGSQAELKLDNTSLNRAPLDVQIPLPSIVGEEDSITQNSRLTKSIEAFLHGWNGCELASEIVDLSDLTAKLQNEKSLHYENEQLSGSLVSADNFHGSPYLEAIIERRTKDGAMLIKKWLQETLRRENSGVNLKIRAGFATKDLRSMIQALVKSQSSLLRNRGIINLAAATLYAMDELHSSKWDAFISAEKILNVNAEDTSQSLAAQISDLINKSALGKPKVSGGLLSLKDALLLTITGYILAGENFPTSGSSGPFSWQEEHFMKDAIVDSILGNPSVVELKFLHSLTAELEANLSKINLGEVKVEPSDDIDDDQWGNWGDDEDADKIDNKEEKYDDMQLKLELRDRVDYLFKSLHRLSNLKKRNIPFREGAMTFESNYTGGDRQPSKGLIYKLLTMILGKHDVPGLEYHSSTVGRIFKSGFGRFGLGQAKPCLVDQDVIMVFVVGGINSVEVREVQEALSESGRPDVELILGGTTLLTPNDMLELLLGKSSYL